MPFAATPFIAAWNPSAKAKAAGAPVKLDVSKMMYGQQIQVAWRKQPVFVIRHSKEALESLSKVEFFIELKKPSLGSPHKKKRKLHARDTQGKFSRRLRPTPRHLRPGGKMRESKSVPTLLMLI